MKEIKLNLNFLKHLIGTFCIVNLKVTSITVETGHNLIGTFCIVNITIALFFSIPFTI